MLPIPDQRGKTLLETMNIQLITSSRSLLQQSAIPNGSKKAVLVGGPDYSVALQDSPTKREFWRELPQAKSEINAVNSILSSNDFTVDTLTGISAQENQLSAISPQVLHFATHAFFWDFDPPVYLIKQAVDDDDVPLNPADEHFSEFGALEGHDITRINPYFRTGVVLAGANSVSRQPNPSLEEDGILFGYEIARLDLTSTELVVLSACSTAKGDLNNGQGLYGLQRAFFEAGADVVIMSLWDVWDSTAKEFMEYFYTNWLDKKMDKTEAFRQSQIQLKKTHPEAGYLWGGFIMVHR